MDRCAECFDADPHVRSAHYMRLATDASSDTEGWNTLRDHITEQYVGLQTLAHPRPDTVADILEWMGALRRMYSGMVDENTGTPIFWWAARKAMQRYRVYGTQKKGTEETDAEKAERAKGYPDRPFPAPSAMTPEERDAYARKQTHLDHKRLLGARYRPPCRHGAQGQSWWPNDVCDPELCDTPESPTTTAPNHAPMSAKENQEALAHLIDTLGVTMDMSLRPKRLSDCYPETYVSPGLYKKPSEEDYRRRRTILLAQMAEIDQRAAAEDAEQDL